jgi:RNA polymerase sigma factor (sigma-70 family)
MSLRLCARDRNLDDPVRYLRTAVLNRARSVLRRRRTVRRFLARAEQNAPLVDEARLEQDQQRALLAAVARLPHRQREVVVLRYYEELTVSEAAALLGITAGAVSSSLNRALMTLNKLLGEDNA